MDVALNAPKPPACGLHGCGGPSPACAWCGCFRRPCAACPVRCCRRDDADAWLADVGGTLDLAPGSPPWPAIRLPEIPDLVPLVAGRLPEGLTPPEGIPLWLARQDLVLSAGGGVQPRWGRRPAREVLGAPDGALIGASLAGPDPPIERLWTNQHRGGLDGIARAGFDVVVGPNYSIYGDQPRFEHRLNLKRSLLFAARLRMRRIPAIPAIYVWRDEDAEALAAWAWEAGLEALAIVTETFRARREWEAFLARYGRLRSLLPSGVRWVFIGVGSKERIITLRELFPGCAVASARPWLAAAHGVRLLRDGGEERHPARFADLLVENLEVMREWVEAA
ncbi:MAG: hypothetical protein QJR08_00585 [Bacillota bacterium]|nr:hypothetical protein [Bacillota bacterium]